MPTSAGRWRSGLLEDGVTADPPPAKPTHAIDRNPFECGAAVGPPEAPGHLENAGRVLNILDPKGCRKSDGRVRGGAIARLVEVWEDLPEQRPLALREPAAIGEYVATVAAAGGPAWPMATQPRPENLSTACPLRRQHSVRLRRSRRSWRRVDPSRTPPSPPSPPATPRLPRASGSGCARVTRGHFASSGPGSPGGSEASSRREVQPESSGEHIEQLVGRVNRAPLDIIPAAFDQLAIQQREASPMFAGSRDDQVLREA